MRKDFFAMHHLHDSSSMRPGWQEMEWVKTPERNWASRSQSVNHHSCEVKVC